METLDYWTPADALAFRCSVAEVGTLRPRQAQECSPVVAGERPDVTEARLYAARAMRALARIAEGEGKPAVDAAKEILLRAYGPALAAPTDAGSDGRMLPAPPWLDQSKRLDYQQADGARLDNALPDRSLVHSQAMDQSSGHGAPVDHTHAYDTQAHGAVLDG